MKKKMILVGILLILAVLMCGCLDENKEGSSGETQRAEAGFTEKNQQRLTVASPPPELDKSLERENLIRRLQLLNDQNKVFYIYLVSYGKVMAFYTAKGKVSSVNSKLTTGEQIVDDPHGSYQAGGQVVESPALDGSYGTNGDAIFFFTTEGAYVEWAGEYMVSDFPLELSTPPALVMNIEEKAAG
ncbi:hypothetical protein KAS79_00155 [Candidatus Parcubacteria bacterium]|nr:hypothetical protein [Candidatus Parcubacteria bacterium]